MDATAFTHAKGEINRLPCVFALALERRAAVCEFATRPPGGGSSPRRAVLCAQPIARSTCAQFDGLLREKSVFAVRRATPDSASSARLALTHIHCGGLTGLRDSLDAAAPAPNVHDLMRQAHKRFGAFEALPWDTVIRAMAAWRPGRRRA